MSWQDDVMAEQEEADALWYMGEAEWRELGHEHHGWQRKEKDKSNLVDSDQVKKGVQNE